jgi:hypothetical protein
MHAGEKSAPVIPVRPPQNVEHIVSGANPAGVDVPPMVLARGRCDRMIGRALRAAYTTSFLPAYLSFSLSRWSRAVSLAHFSSWNSDLELSAASESPRARSVRPIFS